MASIASCLASAALILVACAASAAATSYTVGDASGWTIGVDYSSWAGTKSFKVGDNLVFNYAKAQHTVVEVSAADYLACSAANSLGSDSSGATTVTLKKAGKHYFICSIPGHCAAGMKFQVDVSGSGSGSGAGSGSSSPPSSPTPTTPTPATPTYTPPTPTYTPPTPTYTTPTPPSCAGGTYTPVTPVTPGGMPVTPVTPGTTPVMAYYSGAAGLGPALALASFAMVFAVILVQLGLF